MKHLSSASPLDNARWGRVNFSDLNALFLRHIRGKIMQMRKSGNTPLFKILVAA